MNYKQENRKHISQVFNQITAEGRQTAIITAGGLSLWKMSPIFQDTASQSRVKIHQLNTEGLEWTGHYGWIGVTRAPCTLNVTGIFHSLWDSFLIARYMLEATCILKRCQCLLIDFVYEIVEVVNVFWVFSSIPGSSQNFYLCLLRNSQCQAGL